MVKISHPKWGKKKKRGHLQGHLHKGRQETLHSVCQLRTYFCVIELSSMQAAEGWLTCPGLWQIWNAGNLKNTY